MDCDSFVLSFRERDINNDLKNLEYLFDFSNLDKNYELLSNKNGKVFVYLELKLLKLFG